VTLMVRTMTPGVPRRRRARDQAPVASYAMLAAGLLVVVTTSAGVTVTGWQLAGAEAGRITESVGGVSITGLQLTALRLGGAERETMFISLAADDAGSQFQTAVLGALSP
jgi:hypothetical protein